MRTRVAAGLAGAVLLLVACDGDDPTLEPSPLPTFEGESPTPTADGSPSPTALPTSNPTPTTTEPVDEDGADDHDLSATLTGAEEVPGPGDPAGSGTFTATLAPQENALELCYELTVSDLTSQVTAAHIHVGGPGEAGDPVIDLQAPVAGSSEECKLVNASDAVGLLDDPAGYYVNVHTEGHPDGAVRGQLEGA